MNRLALVALFALLPAVAGAQAIRCKDPATGKILYTDQPCKGGATVVPRPADEQLRLDAERTQQARERAVQQREDAVLRQQQQLDAARTAEAQRPRPVPPARASPRQPAVFVSGRPRAAGDRQIIRPCARPCPGGPATASTKVPSPCSTKSTKPSA